MILARSVDPTLKLQITACAESMQKNLVVMCSHFYSHQRFYLHCKGLLLLQVSKVVLKDGRTLDSRFVVVGVGAKPMLGPFKGLLEEEKGGFKVHIYLSINTINALNS